MKSEVLIPVRHGLMMALLAMILGALWAGFLATQHAALHTGFEAQIELKKSAAETPHTHDGMNHDTSHMHAVSDAHSHTGSLAGDAMQRLLRGHIHFMGLGVLSTALLLVTAFTSLKPCWKKLLGWSFGIGALAYPPAWIIMGFRTIALGPEAAEASIMWLFAPAVGLLLLSMIALLSVLLIEWLDWQHKALFSQLFQA